MATIQLGNCKSWIYTPDVTTKDHYSKMSPLRAIDMTIISQLGATIKMVLDEVNDFNVGLFVLGEQATDGTIGGLTNTNQTGTLTMTGTNSIGPQVSFTGKVKFQPAGDLNVLSDNDDFMEIPLSAKVLLDGGKYGVWTVGGQTAPSTDNYSIPQATVSFTPDEVTA